MASPGETLNLEVMSPVTVAYLLEALSEINKTAEINKVRRPSGPKALQGKSISSESRSSSSFDEEEDGSTSPGSSNGTLPPVSTVFSNDLLTLSSSIAQIIPPASPNLIDVTNTQQLRHHHHHQQQLLQQHDQQQHSTSGQTSVDKTQQSMQLRRQSVSRKRSIELDDVSDDDNNNAADDTVTSRRTKKRSRSSSISSNENSILQTQRRRLPSTRSTTSSKPKSPQPESPTTDVEAPLQDPPKASSDKSANNTIENNKKPARSRRFKEDELSFLDAVYKTEPYPDPMITERLSIQLEVPEHRIKVWFANRRHRQSRDRDNNKPAPVAKPVTEEKKDHQLVTETAALPAESSHASSAFPSSPAFTPQYGMVPSNYEYTHQPLTPSPLPLPQPTPPPPCTPTDLLTAESRRRAQIASTIQSRFPFSSPALIQLANQTMLSRSGLNPYHHHPLNYPVVSSTPPDGFTVAPGADYCDLARMPRRPSNYSYYFEPPILPPLTAESTSYTDGVSLSPAIDDKPSPWHWMP